MKNTKKREKNMNRKRTSRKIAEGIRDEGKLQKENIIYDLSTLKSAWTVLRTVLRPSLNSLNELKLLDH